MDSHLDYFPDNVGHFSEAHGERFHQDIKRQQDKLKEKAVFCWKLKRETVTKGITRKQNFLQIFFEEKKVPDEVNWLEVI